MFGPTGNKKKNLNTKYWKRPNFFFKFSELMTDYNSKSQKKVRVFSQISSMLSVLLSDFPILILYTSLLRLKSIDSIICPFFLISFSCMTMYLNVYL